MALLGAHPLCSFHQLSRVLGLAAAMATVAGAPADVPEAASAAAPADDVAELSDVSDRSGEAAGDELPPDGDCGGCVDDGAADEEEQPEEGRLSVARLVMSPISTIAQRIADRRGRRP